MGPADLKIGSFLWLLAVRILVSFSFFFSSRRRHTRFKCDWSSDVCSSDLDALLAFMRTQRVEADTLERAGLVLPRQSGGGFYDRFRGRLMFAIRDLQGRVVAFGGRAFGDEQPKYLNSPETPLYSKGNLLYAADQARALRMKVALLPAGDDPDTFLRAEGAAAFGERIATARSLLSYALDRVLADGPGPLVPGRGPANAFARAALMLAKVPDAQEAASLSHEAGRKLGVDPTQLWTESRKLAAALSRPVAGARPAAVAATAPIMERDLVALLLHSLPARP